jgi:glycine hydroxymethyltransferase
MDKQIDELIQKETDRQKYGVELIASENYVSEAVLEAMGSILTNKYSEGFPGKRYYGGNEFIDEIENLAISRAKAIFGAEHVNVQPYSGSPANLAVNVAVLKPGDKTLGMGLAAGGHLTHGYKVSASGKFYDAINYGVDEKGYIDYDQVRDLALKHKPKLIWAGFTAYSRIVDWSAFRDIADEVGAVLAADIAHVSGLVAGGVYPTPVPYADIVTTTTHKTLRGPRGAMIMCKEEYAKSVDRAVFPGLQGGPHNHTTAAIAVALGEVMTDEWSGYAEQVVKNAKHFADLMMKRGYKVISGGTDNHMFLVDIVGSELATVGDRSTTVGSNKEMTGGEAEKILESVNITLNKNAIPNDTRKPMDPSGVRIGTPAITTRGLVEKDIEVIVGWIDRALTGEKVDGLKEEVSEYMGKFVVLGSK